MTRFAASHPFPRSGGRPGPTRSRRAVLAVAVAMLLAAAGGAAAQGFDAIATKDGADVWAVGSAGAVYHSLDGGQVWSSVPQGTADLHGVAARGATVLIAGDGGALTRSGDGGFSFASQTLAGGATLRDVWLHDASRGWVAGDGGAILTTTDGGATWAAQASGTSADLHAIRFTSALDGWAAGAAGTLARTTNGGATWTAATPFSVGATLTDVDVSGAEVVVGGTEAFLARSTNGGASWSEKNLRIDSRSDVNGVALDSGGALWITGGGGFLRRSGDGGATWTWPLHPIVGTLTDAVFFDAARGWASAGKSLNVARTTDGGTTWSVPGDAPVTYTWTRRKRISSPSVRGNTFDIDPVNRDKIYAAFGDSIFASWNRGTNWSPLGKIPSAVKTNSFYVSRTDTLTWIAATGTPDRVVKTTNGGASWTNTIVLDFGEYGMPIERDPNLPDHVYFGPGDGTFWKSTDFGSTWAQISNPGFRSPCDLAVLADTSGVIYLGDGTTGGGNGELFRTTDGGLNWTLVYAGSGSEIPMIATSRHDNRLALDTHWGSGGVRRTTDMGLNWIQVAATSGVWGIDIAKDDPNLVVYGDYGSDQLYTSTNGGNSFTISVATNTANYGLLIYDRETHLALQSNGIYKATPNQPGMPVDNSEILAVASPNGGESWIYDAIHPITWSSQNLSTVKIEYSTNAGGSWQTIVAATPGPAGSYPWSIPDAPSTVALVRVSDANDTAPLDLSDATFTIAVARITSNPAALAFGSVTTALTKTDTIRVANPGTATLVVDNVTIASGDPAFAPSRTSFSIPPGSSDTLAVTFDPQLETAYLDTLLLSCNAPDSPLRVVLSGQGVSPVGVASGAPTRFELAECVPNPFGEGGTAIRYALPRDAEVTLTIFDASGRRVARLVEGRRPAGTFVARFPQSGQVASAGDAGGPIPSGVYFCRMEAGDFVETRRLVLVR